MQQILTSYIENQSDEIVNLTFDPCLTQSWKQLGQNMTSILYKKKTITNLQQPKKHSLSNKQPSNLSKPKMIRSRIISQGYNKQASHLVSFKTKILEPLVHNSNHFQKLTALQQPEMKPKVHSTNHQYNNETNLNRTKTIQQPKQKKVFYDFHSKENIQQLKNRMKRMNRISELNMSRKSSINNGHKIAKQQLNVTLQGHGLEKIEKIKQTSTKNNTKEHEVSNNKVVNKNFETEKKKKQKQYGKNNKITQEKKKQGINLEQEKNYLKLTQKLYENNSKQLLKHTQDKIYIHSNLKLSYKSKEPLRRKIEILRN